MTVLIGGDYSIWDPILDWRNHNWDFAIIKGSEGSVPDPRFPVQWAAARGRCIRGVYSWFHHFVDVVKAVDVLLNLLGNDRGELPITLDLEDDDGQPDIIAPLALKWLKECTRRTGKKPIVYSSWSFLHHIKARYHQELAEYPLWLAQYPWDRITTTWTLQHRIDKIHQIINNRELYIIPNSPAPWTGKPTLIQWTGKCPPEFVPGYPLGHKLAVDVNFFPGTLQDFFSKFNITYTPIGDDDMASKPVTMTAELISGMESRFRNAPGTVGTTIFRTLVGPLTIKGTGEKVLRDGYWWIEVVFINDQPATGWVALTTSYRNIIWTENPIPSPTRNIVKNVTHFDDGSTFETFPR